MTQDVVLYEVTDRIATITLNRPDRLNAWTPQLSSRYFQLLDQAADDPGVRAIVVTGAGRGFCAGADMEVLQGRDDREVAEVVRPVTHATTIPKPVIAAVNGPCAGIGLVHALMADVRFAAAGAKFTTAFSRRGLVAEHGSSWVLPRLVGQSAALDLLLSGRVFPAEEALQLRMVNRVFEPGELMDQTYAYARDLATSCSPTAMATMKYQVYRAYHQSLDDALAEANQLMAKSFSHPDFREGVSSFVEKREPAFEPLGGQRVP